LAECEPAAAHTPVARNYGGARPVRTHASARHRYKDLTDVNRVLDSVAGLVDAGKIRSTVAEHFGTINAANLKRVHALLETGKARGKIVLEGF
jgi:NADPH:quinone reductase-like Zn-dependent oxidoreductase